ncbi:MAG TPA: hypothetical protein VGL79_04915, partial [Solirubrobacteraceae bacterium]
MSRFRRVVRVCVLAGVLTMATGVSAASASTLFVNGATGNDANPCTSAAAPCKTIGAAVGKSQLILGNATIEVAAGAYKETLDLDNAADNGITINGSGSEGSGTVIEGPGGKQPTFELDSPGTSALLSNLRIVAPLGQEGDGIENAGELTLNNVLVDMRNAGKYEGIESEEIGSLAINGGGVTMESGNEGVAVADDGVPLSLNGAQLTVANGAKGTALEGGLAAISLSNVTISLGDTAVSSAVEMEFPTSFSANGLTISIADPSNKDAAVVQEFGSSTYDHLQIGGTWTGAGLETEGGTTTIIDSRLTTSGAEPAVAAIESGEGPGLIFQRSIAEVPPTATAAIYAINSNATLDSAEVLGGKSAIVLGQNASKERMLTVAGSTIDAGVLGERDGPGVSGVSVETVGPASLSNVNIEGSIVLEPQVAIVAPGGATANINCTYSDVPSQTQAATGAEGTINCANGASGNTATGPLTSLFSAPVTSYNLLPGTPAIDSVPASAISLPFGIAPSTTDLAGNPRVVDGNGDCKAAQDMGALELQGHSAACPIPLIPPPPPPPAKAVLGILAHLQISPSSFFAAPSGATTSKASKKTKKTYGTSVSYSDSQAATTTFTVLRETPGRKQGKACAKPSKANKH